MRSTLPWAIHQACRALHRNRPIIRSHIGTEFGLTAIKHGSIAFTEVTAITLTNLTATSNKRLSAAPSPRPDHTSAAYLSYQPTETSTWTCQHHRPHPRSSPSRWPIRGRHSSYDRTPRCHSPGKRIAELHIIVFRRRGRRMSADGCLVTLGFCATKWILSLGM